MRLIGWNINKFYINIATVEERSRKDIDYIYAIRKILSQYSHIRIQSMSTVINPERRDWGHSLEECSLFEFMGRKDAPAVYKPQEKCNLEFHVITDSDS